MIKLAECGRVEAEMRERKVCVRYVKDGEDRWSPVVRRRRKMSARSESGDSSCDLGMDGGKLVEYCCFVIPGVHIHS